ncbi:sialoadhesin-like [Polypterus senegalus]|uniref:sialoadhesin-like n=1 Tax=Polypterus senegalus TaxID=55291 RepID=UPI00196359D6|nr:sialoadhesin-like [Polypterus senegalus]
MRICALEGSTVRINCSYWHPAGATVEHEMLFYDPDENNTVRDAEHTVCHSDEQKVARSPRQRVQFLGNKHEKTCDVKISDVSRKESGFYKFRVEGNDKWTQVPGVNMTITGLMVEAEPKKVKENEAVALTCRTNYSLNGSVFSWLRNGQRLSEASEKLEIPKASDEDHSSYVCQTGNISSPEFLLNVEYLSEWGAAYKPKRICALEGSTVRINCTYRHPPNIAIKKEMWFHDSEENKQLEVGETTVYHTSEHGVSCSHRQRVQFLGKKNEKTCDVKISDVRREDSGYYKFIFEGPDNWTQVPGVHVRVTGLKVEMTPEQVKENDAVNLSCTTNCSLVNSIFSWFRNGQHLNETSKELQIQRVSIEDHGNYWCQTGNINISPAFLLNVEYAPRNVVITGQPIACIEEETSVALHCKALANPPSNYTWVKENGGHVGSGEQLHISKFNMSHNGYYYCEATNIHGTAKSAAAHLTVNENIGFLQSIFMNYVFYGSLNIIILLGLALLLFVCLWKRTKKTNQQGGRETVVDTVYEDIVGSDAKPAQQKDEEKEEEHDDVQTPYYATVEPKASRKKRMQAKEQEKKKEEEEAETEEFTSVSAEW